MPKHPFSALIRILPIFCLVLTNCVNTHHQFSGSLLQLQSSHTAPTQQLGSIQIGITTKQEIIRRFGNPTDQQMSTREGVPIESLSYADSEIEIRPYQYIPFFGAFAFWRTPTHQNSSAAISFSSDEKVSGLTISTVNAYGDIRSSELFSRVDSTTSFYGMNNPEVSHTPTSD